MSKKHTLTFSVTVEFADEVLHHNDVQEVANNIANALESEVQQGLGLSPHDGETHTKSIEVELLNVEGVRYKVTKTF